MFELFFAVGAGTNGRGQLGMHLSKWLVHSEIVSYDPPGAASKNESGCKIVSPPIVPARLDWPSAIGTLLLNFGTLEYFVLVFLKDRVPEEEFAKLKKIHLKDRLARMADQMCKDGSSAEEQAKFARLVERLQPIRELRNDFAHGHIYCRLDQERCQWIVTVLRAKDVDTGLLPGTRHVQFSEIEKALTELPKLMEEVESLCGFRSDVG